MKKQFTFDDGKIVISENPEIPLLVHDLIIHCKEKAGEICFQLFGKRFHVTEKTRYVVLLDQLLDAERCV